MKNLVLALSLICSAQVFSKEITMGKEAKEIFNLLTHRQVQACIRDLDLRLVNLEIKKTVFPPTTYIITGSNKGYDDLPAAEKTVITLKGASQRGYGGRLVQTFECSIKN